MTKEKIELKVYSVKSDGTLMEHTEITDYNEVYEDEELVGVEFFFRPLKPVAKVVLRAVEEKEEPDETEKGN